MYSPFFAMYVKELGGSYAEFAIVLSVTGFVLSVIQSYVGYLSDKIGAGRLVLIGGGISAIGMILTGVIYHSFFILPLYLLMSIGMGILVPSVFSVVSYMKTKDGDSFIPTYRSIQGVGVIIGPIVGGWLIGSTYRGNVFVSALLMVLSVILFSVCFVGEKITVPSSDTQGRTKMNYRKAISEVLHNRTFLIVMLLFATIELSYDLIRMNLPIAGAKLGHDTEMIGIALSAYFVMFTLFQIPINKKLRTLKKRTALLFMGLFSLIPCAALAITLPDYCTVIIMSGVGLTVGSLFTYCSVLASDECPDDKKGTYMGVFNTIMPCTDVISPLLTAGLAAVHIKGPYILAVLLILAFIILSSFLYPKGSDNM